MFHSLLYFHISVKKKEIKKPYGFAFVRLTNTAQIVIKDADHELIVYHVSLFPPDFYAAISID